MDRSRLVRWLREHPRGADGLLAAAVTGVTLVAHLIGTGMSEQLEIRTPSWWTVPLVAAATVPIAWRRTAPVTAAFVVVVAQSAMEVLRLEGSGWLGVVVAVYSVGAHGVDRRRTVGAAGLFGIVGLLLVSGVIVRQIALGVLVGTSAVVVSAYLFGDNVRRRRLHLESLAERAERAEREQELIARSRVRDERTRLARELHDVVAHSVSVMIIQSGAARRSLPDRPDDATAMLHEVELSGRRAMDELRRVLGVLRSDTDHEPVALDPQPGLDDLQALLDHDPGLPVTLVVDESVCSLPEGVAVSAYRLVQESLTNVRRHAGDVRSVEVRLRRCDDILEVEVTDDGRGAATTTAATAGAAGVTADADGTVHPGFGLAGMHERATALGGSVTAGPRRGGGWRVHAELPIGTPT